MAGSLIKIDEEIVTSAVASVSLLGIDSTYDVYMVRINNMIPTTDGALAVFRVTESGTPNTTSNYDRASVLLRTDSIFAKFGTTNENLGYFGSSSGTAGNESANGILYIFNANNASEYTFFTREFTTRADGGSLRGAQGGNVFTSVSSVDGIQLFFTSGNIDTGSSFVLYGLKK